MSAFRTSIRRVPCGTPQALNACHYATQAPRQLFFPQVAEFSPLFRLFEEADRTFNRKSVFGDARGFSPKVDIREEEAGYLIQAEVPGIEQKNINIEWADANTLRLSGSTEQHAESSSEANTANNEKAVESVAQSAPSSPQPNQATVEDTEDEDAPVIVPRVESDAASTVTAEASKSEPEEAAQPSAAQEPKYWISERSVGSFARSFKFSSRVDHDAVKASLANGILSIVVPKAQPIQPRRINIG